MIRSRVRLVVGFQNKLKNKMLSSQKNLRSLGLDVAVDVMAAATPSSA